MNGKKISAHAVGAAIAAIVVWALQQYGKVAVPPEVAVAFGTVAAVVVSIVTPDDKED